MKNKIRPIFLFILFWLHWQAAASAADDLIVVGFHDNTPLIFTDTDGQVKGIAVDLLSYIADEEGWQLRYLPGSYSECTRRLEENTIDLFPGMAVAKENENRFVLGKETIVSNWGQLYTASDAVLSDILDFQDKDVAVVTSDIYFQFFATTLEKFGIHSRFVQVDSYGEVLSLIHHKEVAAGIVPRLYGAYYEKRFRVRRSPVSFRHTELRFAICKDQNRKILATLDRYLNKLKENPNSIFYSSLDRWTQGVRKVTLPLWLRPLWVLSAIAGFMGLIILGNVFLRRQVKLQTEALKVTIAEKEKIESELSVAREIQSQLVPAEFPAFSNRKEFDIYASLEPAREVGGDFYDCFFIDGNHLCLVIGDVSGKGMPAALFMAMTKTMIKSAARLLAEPEYILADVNREISRNNPSLTFVTVFLGVLNLSSGELTYSCAGHNPPLFIGRKGNSVLLGDAQCPAIGFDDTFQYRQAVVKMQHGESLLLYTDGVTEAQNSQDHLFTQESLMNTVSLTAGLSPKQRVVAIVSRIREFTGERPLDDDLTLLSLTYFSPHHIDYSGKTIVLRNDIHEMSRIIEAITQVAESAACPRVVVHDVTLAIEEVFSNIVFYGFGDDLDHNITLELFIEDNALILILQDGGIPFNPLNVQANREKPLEERDKGGMGIMLAKNLMDRIEYRRDQGKNILRLEKRFR
ncbi:SpoIIE family protein phosphatase [uncultured Desulfosarcina sp.]|uniref:SpoIIE family protein phosphatase n=1 Tax=uncultured Desulfosarcina sp. TaxID=218289 RepID=UPI0029C91CCB|nr:SpoIIE family protein phosphatase [uncultured Desulfosarcina sp.]